MPLKHYGNGIAKGLAVTMKNLLRKPITTQYPEQKLVVSRRIRGNVLGWSPQKCIGCHTCAHSCPHGCIDITTTEKGNKGLVPAPCTQGCPSHVDAARYIRAIYRGEPEEAVAIIRERIPFPSVCAYICAHPCETACTRGTVDEPIAIRMLKRFAVDNDNGFWKKNSKIAPASGKRVAIIGSGPAGLTAAYYLAKLGGHRITVFEALPVAGGMMRVGIPDYRLPPHILQADIAEIENIGVRIELNTRVDSPQSLLDNGYDAVFVAIGAHQAIEVGVSGDDDPRVLGGVYFLRQVNLGQKVALGDRVAVIGGGNTAMDSARTAIRLGSKEVTIVYRRTRAEMPASTEEIEEAIDEGVKFIFLAAPSKITSDSSGLTLECIRMKLGPEDASGRRRPEPITGSEFTIALDNVIAAISQQPEVPSSFNLATGKGSKIEADPDTLATSQPGIFAGGDAVLGPAIVIEAIAAGRKAAIAIDKYLGGSGNIDETLAPAEEVITRDQSPRQTLRPPTSAISHKLRVTSFKGVELGWNPEAAVAETQRCLRCDLSYEVASYQLNGGLCIYCGLCVESCPFDALFMGYSYERGSYRLGQQLLNKEELVTPDKIKPSGYAHPEIEETLPEQTLLIDRA